jgi:pyruvate kinase
MRAAGPPRYLDFMAGPDMVSESEGVDGERVLADALRELRAEMLEVERRAEARLECVGPGQRASAANLLHYLALRRHDLRTLQTGLARKGLSSLGRSESHALAAVEAVLNVVERLSGQAPTPPVAGLGAEQGAQLLRERTEALLGGGGPASRAVRIMVTLPSEAADPVVGPALMSDLLEAGTDAVRINTAHDDAAAWARMIEHVRGAEARLNRQNRCRVLMDLAGPKVRTGPIAPGPAVERWHPLRGELGQVLEPARVVLMACPDGRQVDRHEAGATLGVNPDWLARLHPGDRVGLRDARGKKRELTVVGLAPHTAPGALLATCGQSAYVTPGTQLHAHQAGGRAGSDVGAGRVTSVPRVEQAIALSEGDTLVLTRELSAGCPAGSSGPARIGCTLPEAFSCARVGQRVMLDDGKIAGVIRSSARDAMDVEITRTKVGGAKLRSDKGINFPDTDLPADALTEADERALAFVADHADMVGLSFVSSTELVRSVAVRLGADPVRPVGLVLKIETRRAFEALPELLLEALRTRAVGVMIARGDLAVECGFERLAEVQEEILWMCEAAHVPVIWATQVLESLAKKGVPTRAEITDAAMSVRAECVMLNKGPYIAETVRALDDIVERMAAHQQKKRSMLRPLNVARGFGGSQAT